MTIALADNRLKTYAGFVKLEHTVFSLPLIFAGALLGLHHWPDWRLSLLILLAAVGGRVAAMGLNRIIDLEIDSRNPRTKNRELPRGAMTRMEAWLIVGLALAVYAASAWLIAPLCLWLAPIPVALFATYPYLKRFTSLAHFGLGLAWSMVPLGGWVAAAANVPAIPVPNIVEGRLAFGEVSWLWLFAVLWVAGFDVIYATMDEAFDRKFGLHSLPAKLGKREALRIAALLHVNAFMALALLWHTQLHSLVSLAWLAGIGALFIWQHLVADRRPEFAFFQLNGVLGFLVLGLISSGM